MFELYRLYPFCDSNPPVRVCFGALDSQEGTSFVAHRQFKLMIWMQHEEGGKLTEELLGSPQRVLLERMLVLRMGS